MCGAVRKPQALLQMSREPGFLKRISVLLQADMEGGDVSPATPVLPQYMIPFGQPYCFFLKFLAGPGEAGDKKKKKIRFFFFSFLQEIIHVQLGRESGWK